MKRYFYLLILAVTLLCTFDSALLSAATKDACRNEGMIVKNMTMLDLWYKKNGGACTIWIHNHVFRIKPKDKIVIFSDMVCKKPYCPGNPAYKDYKSFDTDGNCRVRILPDCNISDM